MMEKETMPQFVVPAGRPSTAVPSTSYLDKGIPTAVPISAFSSIDTD